MDYEIAKETIIGALAIAVILLILLIVLLYVEHLAYIHDCKMGKFKQFSHIEMWKRNFRYGKNGW